MKHPRFHFGDWEIEPEANRITRPGEQRRLEPRTMDVLVALCRQPGTILSSESLLEQCWGTVVHGDNPVHKTIAQLRRALGDRAASPTYIETIRKRGYRAIAPTVHESSIGPRTVDWTQDSPFRGLQAFDAEHSDVFFGRATARHQLQAILNRLLQLPPDDALELLVLLGPSGSGKTSLVQAGLIPDLLRARHHRDLQLLHWTKLDLGEVGELALFTAMGSALLDWQQHGHSDAPTADQAHTSDELFAGHRAFSLGDALRQYPDRVVSELLGTQVVPQPAAADNTDSTQTADMQRYLLFIDRFEAFFTSEHISDEERRGFLQLLERLARSRRVIVILACRNDFYPQIASCNLLMEAKAQQAHFDVTAPTMAEIAQIVRLPVQAAGLHYGSDSETGARLDDVLCDHAKTSPDALPLLQYTLQELYSSRGEDGELSYAAYQQLGGLEGALSQRAEQLISSLDEAARARLPQVLSLVVTISDNDGAITSRRAARASLPDLHSHTLVNALVESRLFVSELIDGEPGFGIAHEAILRRWPRATSWIETHRKALRIRARLGEHTNRWLQEGRRNDLLLPRGKLLDEARTLLQLQGFTITDSQRELIHVSQRRASRGTRLRYAALSAIIGLSVLTTTLALQTTAAKRVAQERRVQAENLVGYMLGDFADKLRPLARLDLLDGISGKALEYLAHSNDGDLSPAALRQRAAALLVIGEVRVARGDTQAAITAFETASEILNAQLDSVTADHTALRDTLQSLGLNAFWLGQIHLNHGDWEQTEHHFQNYLEYSDRLNQLEPDNVEWWIEQSYAHNNLGTLALRRGHSERASAEFNTSITLKARAAEQRPDDLTLAAELADSLSWLGSLKETQGELDAAMALYQRELTIVREIRSHAAQDALWQQRHALALHHQGDLKLALGDYTAASADFSRSRDILSRLLQHEPENRLWQRSHAYALLRHYDAQTAAGTTLSPDDTLQPVSQLAEQLLALDADNAEWLRLAAMVKQRQAAQLQRRGHTDLAQQALNQATQHLHQSLQRNPNDTRSRWLHAETLLAQAALAAPGPMTRHTRGPAGSDPANSVSVSSASDSATTAQAYCRQAIDLLSSVAVDSRDYHVLDPWIRAHHCVGEYEAVTAAVTRLEEIDYKGGRHSVVITASKT